MGQVKIAIAQVDGKWPNLALAKLTAWYRQHDVEVEWFNPLLPADTVFASKIFTDTEDDPYLPAATHRGGSGYDLQTKLSPEIEATKPDWSMWPQWTKDVGFTTRGCIRHCRFCNVYPKEGRLHVVAGFDQVWTGRADLVLLDANIVAAPLDHLRELCAAARRHNVRLDYSQGLDARLLTDEQIDIILAAPHQTVLKIAFDNLKDEAAVRRTIRLFREAGFNTRRNLIVFVLIGFDSTEEDDLYRIELVQALGAVPFVMPFDRSDPYQHALTRWCNRVAVSRSCSWREYVGMKKKGQLGWDIHPAQLPLTEG